MVTSAFLFVRLPRPPSLPFRRGHAQQALGAIKLAIQLKPNVEESEYRAQTSLNACAVLSELGRFVALRVELVRVSLS